MILFLTAIFCIPAEAAETSSLTLYFNPEGAVFHLYRTADLESDGSYTFSGQFADCPAVTSSAFKLWTAKFSFFFSSRIPIAVTTTSSNCVDDEVKVTLMTD